MFWVNRYIIPKERAKGLCPHVTLLTNNHGKPALRSTFISPPGTVAWQCQSCGAITYDKAWIDENTMCWLNNTRELMKRYKKITKL